MGSAGLRDRIRLGKLVVAGVLSGTSADGIDVILFSPQPRAEGGFRWTTHAFETVPFDPVLGGAVRRVLDGEALDLAGVSYLHRDLGLAFGRAVQGVGAAVGLGADLVGSHGQTVWHHDGKRGRGRASLQLGDGDFIAEASGAAVVSDFRQRDLAAGGEGAPIGHLVDPWLFPKLPRPGAILNLGGFGNLTLLDANGVHGSFDTGPAGALLDGLARACLGAAMDKGGRCAASGQVLEREFAGWMTQLDEFLRAPPPRSTGRDTFGSAWVAGLVGDAEGARPGDLLATGVAVVAECVKRSLVHVPRALQPRALVVAGGGAYNPELLRGLKSATGLPVESSAEHGVDPGAREALIFGFLAVAHVLGSSLSVANTAGAVPTGAKPGRVLGKFSPAVPGPPTQNESHE